MGRRNAEKKEENVAVAIDKDKGSQYALKWAVDHLLSRGQSLTLLHVRQKPPSPNPSGSNDAAKRDTYSKDLFLPFRCFCTRKDIACNEVMMEENDIVKAILDFVASFSIEILILGAPSRSGLVRFKSSDVPSTVSKGAPNFCTVYVIAKGRILSTRSATGPAPPPRASPQSLLQNKASNVSELAEAPSRPSQSNRVADRYAPRALHDDSEIKSPFTRRGGSLGKSHEPFIPDTDISFVNDGRPSVDRLFPSFYDTSESEFAPRLSNLSELDYRGVGPPQSVNMSFSSSSSSSSSMENTKMPWSSINMMTQEDVEAEMWRLRLELKQTMELYSSACRDALTARQKAMELHQWKLEEEQRLEEARLAEEAALALVEQEKAKCKAAIEAAEAAQRLAQLEAQKRMNAERRALMESEKKSKAVESLAHGNLRYRRYTIEEIEAATHDFTDSLKIGEGGYGPVYKCHLDHTEVAVKVLRSDAAQGRSQFQQEVEVLSRIRHPNMVLLLGACPEYGCLVYEYMANGSLDDRLFQRDNTPPLSWQLRFRIAAEIATGLLFLHQTKPEPLVHRDLKPGNILLDRNFVSKISDVGLARLVPPSVANAVTQYRMTSTAGTFCYIDPEYQQTGMLGIKSDIYSLGIMLLQIITAKQPMGLAHHVERAIEKGTFAGILDPAVPDWPVQEALKVAEIALKCAELRRKDRPDLGTVILPKLNRLRELAEEQMPNTIMIGGSKGSSPSNSQNTEVNQDVISNPQYGYESSSASSYGGKR